MENLKYKIIKTESQYYDYCKILESLVFESNKSKGMEDEIDLLTLLIEKWDGDYAIMSQLDPIALIKSLMKDHKLRSKNLAEILNVSEGLVSDILNNKKGLSKETIRILSDKFKLNQDALNKPYQLNSAYNARLKDASAMNTKNDLIYV